MEKMLAQMTGPGADRLAVREANISTPDTPCGQLLPNPMEILSDKWEGSVMEHFSSWAAKDPERVCTVGF